MEFGQLIKNNMSSKIFLEKSYTRFGGKASPSLFFKKIKIQLVSGSTISIVINFVFIVGPSRGLPNIFKKMC